SLVTTTAKHDDGEGDTSHPSGATPARHDDAKPGTSHTLRDVASSVRQTVKSVVKKAAEQPHHAASG
ncbi:MAG: hypothetical protein QOG79_3025, partial [Mycobacterium sp.]|nr:hypothetical protein [Mycobacterium sp.]